MKFSIVEEISPDVIGQLKDIRRISESLNVELSKRDYGSGVDEVIFGINCVNPKLLGFAGDFETGKVIFKRYSKVNRLLDFSVKLNHHEIMSAPASDIVNILKEAFSKSYFEVAQLSIQRFAIEEFYGDVVELFDTRGWLMEMYKEKIFVYDLSKDAKLHFLDLKRMSIDAFWEIIDWARVQSQGDFERQIAIIINQLATKEGRDIVGFECTLRQKLLDANRYDVMAMQKIIEGAVHDDSFLYFRCKLVLYGRIIFESALNNPDYIDERIDPFLSGEPLLTVTDAAFRLRFGEHTDLELPREYAMKFIDYNTGGIQVHGDDWEETDLKMRYPRLWGMYNIK